MNETGNFSDCKLSAYEVVAKSERIDLHIKYAYAKYRKFCGVVPKDMTRLYLESIKAFNSFVEAEPKKIGPSEFLTHYEDLIESLLKNGYLEEEGTEKVLLSREGEVVSGAHRIASCAAFEVPVTFSPERNIESPNFNFNFFQNKGISGEVLDLASLTKVHLDPNTKALIVHSIVSDEKFDEITSYIQDSQVRVYSIISKRLDLSAISALKYINYRSEANMFDYDDWTYPKDHIHKGLLDHAIKSFGRFNTRVLLISEIYEGEVRQLKKELREKLRLSNFEIHSTEEHFETKNTIEVISNSILLRIISMNTPRKICIALERLQVAREIVKRNGLRFDSFVVGGSFILELAGYRNARDLDLYVEKLSGVKEVALREIKGFDIEWHEISSFNGYSSIEAIKTNILESFELLNFRFVPLRELYNFKQARAEFLKDNLDLKALVELLDQTPSNGKLERVSTAMLMIAWKLSSKLSLYKANIVAFLYKIEYVRNSYKVLKKWLKN